MLAGRVGVAITVSAVIIRWALNKSAGAVTEIKVFDTCVTSLTSIGIVRPGAILVAAVFREVHKLWDVDRGRTLIIDGIITSIGAESFEEPGVLMLIGKWTNRVD